MKSFLMILLFYLSLMAQGQSHQVIDSVQKETWFVNSRYGIVFEAPKVLVKMDFKMPEGADMAKNINYYIYKGEDWGIFLFVMETEITTYDLEKGLRGGITNQLLSANAENIKLEFTYPEKENCIYCDGKAEIKGNGIVIRGFGSFNGKGRTCSLFGISSPNATATSRLNRVFNNINTIDY